MRYLLTRLEFECILTYRILSCVSHITRVRHINIEVSALLLQRLSSTYFRGFKMKRFLLLLVVLMICNWGCQNTQQQNLQAALTWNRSRSYILRTLQELEQTEKKGVSSDSLVQERLGDHNFTFWLLRTHPDRLPKHDFEYKVFGKRRRKLLELWLERHASFIALQDVYGFEYDETEGRHWSGEFKVENPLLEGRFLFWTDQQQDGKIVKLVIPRNKSDKMKGGIVIYDLTEAHQQ